MPHSPNTVEETLDCIRAYNAIPPEERTFNDEVIISRDFALDLCTRLLAIEKQLGVFSA